MLQSHDQEASRLPALRIALRSTVWFLVSSTLATATIALMVPSAPPAPAPSPPPAAPTWEPTMGRASDALEACQLRVMVVARDPLEAPIVDAKLSLARVGSDRTLEVWAALTDSGGAHRFAALPQGLYHLTVAAPGRPLTASPVFRCDESSARGFVHVTAPDAGAALAGRITGLFGKAVAGAELLVAQPEGAQSTFAGVAHVRVDEDGRFSTTLAKGRYQLLATAPSHTAQMQMVTIGEEAKAKTVFALEFTPRVEGRVVDEEGGPVRDALVHLGATYDPKAGRSSARTDAEGRFSLAVAGGQALHLSARGEGLLGSVDLQPVTSLSGLSGVQIVAHAGRVLRGAVQNVDGSPKPYADVAFRVRDLGLSGVERADAEGRFVLSGMPLLADVEVWADGNATGAWGAVVAGPHDENVLLTYVAPAYR